MTDDVNDFDIDDEKDIDVPADAVENTDDATDDDYDLDFTGLTDEEIAAINADDDQDGDDTDGVGDDVGDNSDSATDDSAKSDNDTSDSNTDGDNPDGPHAEDDSFTQEAATVAETRAAIDAEYDAQLAKLDELGEKYDNGDIADGAYNAAKARLDRELKRIEVREAELVTKEDAIAERETSKQEQFQNAWATATTEFMARPENKVFVEGSPEFAALDNQIGAIAPSMPPGTPFDVLLNKARSLVANYMTLPDAEATTQKDKPVDKAVKPDPQTMPSISNMPAVVENTTDGNKYAHLDKLDGPALERAIADMPQAQQDEYLLNS